MAQGIGNEIGQHLIEPVIVGGELLIGVCDVRFQINAEGCGLGGETRSDVRYQVGEQEAGRVKRKLSRFGEGEGLQVVHEAGEQLSFIQCSVDVFGRRLIDAVHDAFEVALDDVERRAEFVGDVGGEVAALLFGALEFANHFVEAFEQVAEHIGVFLRHTYREITFLDSVDGVEKLFERSAEADV